MGCGRTRSPHKGKKQEHWNVAATFTEPYMWRGLDVAQAPLDRDVKR